MKLHHIGILVNDIEAEAKQLCDALGYTPETEIIADPIQEAKVLFLKQPSANEYLELVSPLDDKSKLSNALKKAVRMHHICYQVKDIYAELQKLRDNKFFVICEPVDAVAFSNRKIAWAFDMFKNLIELVEEGDDVNAPLYVK